MVPETSKNKLNHQSPQLEESTSELIKVTVNTKDFVSYSLENDTPQSELLTEYCESQNSFTRIFLLRHLPYKECREYSLYEDIRDKLKEKLTNDEIHKYLEEEYGDFYSNLIKIFKKEKNPIKSLFSMLDDSLCTDSSILDPNLYNSIFQDQKNTIFIHNPIDSSKERIKQSVNYIKNKYPGITIIEKNIVGSQKGIDKQLAVIKAGEELVEIIVDIKSEIKQENSKLKGKNIVILGSRSHSHFLNVKKFDANGKDKSENEFEEKGYDFIDLDYKSELIGDTTKLIITPENYQELKSLFQEIQHNSITNFQDKVNTYFMENPELFEENISKNNIDLQIFCIINLLEKSKFDIIHKNKNLLENPKIKQSIIQANPKYEIIINYYENIYPYISETRSRSLDQRIINGEDIEPFFTFSNEEYQDIKELKLLTEGKSIKYIEGNAGNGKSFLLSQIAEKIHKYNLDNLNTGEILYNCSYINLSGRSLELLNNIELKTGYNNIILIDSIDESSISGEDRKKLDDELLKLADKGFKIVITSRNGYLHNYKDTNEDNKQKMELSEKQEIIELKDFDEKQINNYLDKYFINKKEKNIKIIKANQIVSKLNGVGNNPLILCMICEIVDAGGIKDRKIEDITIIDIYNEIIEKKIINGNSEDKNRNLTNRLSIEDIVSIRKDFLSKVGYKMSTENRSILKEELDHIIDNNKQFEYGIHTDLESIDLIFKKKSDGSHDFVHQSFKEYFAAKRLFEKIKQIGCFEFDFKKLESYNYKIIDFLIEFIKEDKEFEKIFVNMICNTFNVFKQYNNNTSHNFYNIIKFYIGKFIYILGKLDPDKESKLNPENFFNDNNPTNYRIIQGFLKLKTKKNIDLIKNYLIFIIKNPQYDEHKHFNPVIELFISEGLEKEVYNLFSKEIYSEIDFHFLNETVFDILYKHTDDKEEFLKNIFKEEFFNNIRTYNIRSLIEHIYKIIITNHSDDVEYIFGGKTYKTFSEFSKEYKNKTITQNQDYKEQKNEKITKEDILKNIENEIDHMNEWPELTSKPGYDYETKLSHFETTIFNLENILDNEFEDVIKILFHKINTLNDNGYYRIDRYYDLIFTLIEVILKKFTKNSMGFLDDFFEMEFKCQKLNFNYKFALELLLGKYAKTKLQIKYFKYLVLEYNWKEAEKSHGELYPALSNIAKFAREDLGENSKEFKNYGYHVSTEVKNGLIKLCLEENKEEDIKHFIPKYVCISDL